MLEKKKKKISPLRINAFNTYLVEYGQLIYYVFNFNFFKKISPLDAIMTLNAIMRKKIFILIS
jgi:hypothetical protein